MFKVINLFGGPGSGKSTFATYLFAHMKICNYNVELVTEFAKDLVYENQYNILQTDQLYVLANQNRRLQRLLNDKHKVDYVITDSPLILSNIYCILNNYPFKDSLSKFTLELFNSYNNINFFLERNEKEFNPNGRIQNLQQSIKIDNLIINHLNENNIPYITIKQHQQYQINNLLKYII